MPIYDYDCIHCGIAENVWAGVNDDEVPCPKCGCNMNRLISATRSNPDWQPYLDENLVPMHGSEPTWVKSRQHRKELMKQFGLVDKWSGL